MRSNNGQQLVAMMGFHATAWLSHWTAPTKTNEHAALGELYDSWGDNLDKLAELCMGKARSRDLPTAQLPLKAETNYAALIKTGLGLVTAFRFACEPGIDDDVLNVLADMSHSLNLAAYKLQV